MRRIKSALLGCTLFSTLAAHAAPADDPRPTAAREAENAVQEARDELAGDTPEPMGMVGDHYIHDTVTFDVAGAAFGDGVNGQYVRSWNRKVSTVLGANYARTDGQNGSITKFGAEIGVDYFLLGQHNEGLRIGPRIVGSVGVDTTGGNAGFGDIGAGAELGYNFISTQGLTAGAAAGWDIILEGQLGNNAGGGFAGHPYGKLNIGYSW